MTAPDPLERAQLLLTVLDEGRRTATYKLAVLLALLDSCVLGADERGQAPQRIATRDLAARVVELYWPQVRDQPKAPGGVYYRQSTQPRAVTVQAVRALWELGRAHGLRSPTAVAGRLPEQFAQTLDVVELNLVQMPLGKLQRPSGYTQAGAADYPRFLYDDAPFHEGVTLAALRRSPLHVDLRPGVGAWLVSLAGLLRPLVELHWTRAVARFNGRDFPEDDLRAFLFGSTREDLGKVRTGLRDAQDGRCFYCGGPLVPGAVQVDHFVPWSRLPNDALANLVLADSRCNGSKSDHFADVPLLQRWATRETGPLAVVAAEQDWPLGVERSRAVARGLYAQLASAQQLWVAPGVFRVLDRAELDEVLPALR